jgi:hypothetical protein
MLMQLGYESAEAAIMVLENTQTRVDACRQRVNEQAALRSALWVSPALQVIKNRNL